MFTVNIPGWSSLAASILLLSSASCSKHQQDSKAPISLHYTVSNGISLKGKADSSVTPMIEWQGRQGQFSLAGAFPTGITINAQSGRISWPANLPIGSYRLQAIASNGSAQSDTADYIITVSGPISTIAGVGQYTYGGDEGPATTANLHYPQDVSVDADGNIYIADSENHRVRRIGADGIIHTIAGDGTLSGDKNAENGIPATQTQIDMAVALANDDKGNLYITDQLRGLIRKVDAAGIITTIVGPVNGNDSIGDEGPATSFRLRYPSGKIVFDSDGTFYFADYINERIRKVTPDGILHTIAGTGAKGAIPVKDGTPALQADLAIPTNVGYDPASNTLYFTNYLRTFHRLGNNTIYGLSSTRDFNNEPMDVEGKNVANCHFSVLGNIAMDKEGNIFCCDVSANKVYRIDTKGIVCTIAGTGNLSFGGDGGPAAAAFLFKPFGIALDANGDLYIADTFNSRIRKVILH